MVATVSLKSFKRPIRRHARPNETHFFLDAVCGLPGYSKQNTFLPKQRIYRTNDVVEYACENKDLVLIGPTKRLCLNGNWEGRIPKCGNR